MVYTLKLYAKVFLLILCAGKIRVNLEKSSHCILIDADERERRRLSERSFAGLVLAPLPVLSTLVAPKLLTIPVTNCDCGIGLSLSCCSVNACF